MAKLNKIEKQFLILYYKLGLRYIACDINKEIYLYNTLPIFDLDKKEYFTKNDIIISIDNDCYNQKLFCKIKKGYCYEIKKLLTDNGIKK